jgi:hypothetical protein
MRILGYTILASLLFCSCDIIKLQDKGLYDYKSNEKVKANINGFSDLIIFEGALDNSVWASPETQCVTMTKEEKEMKVSKSSMHLKWDKVSGGCKWIGIGFGWNNWLGKDMSEVMEEAAIVLYVKAADEKFSNLPVAFALEDYSGTQAYLGFNKKMVSGDFTPDKWTPVILRLKDFPFKEKDFDTGNVKQFMIQLEGDGNIYLDDIKIIRLQ